MSTATLEPPSEMEIFRRIVDSKQALLSAEAARAIMGLDFSATDRKRMNELAAKNRNGKVSAAEEEELGNYIRVGQILGILQSKARRSLPGEIKTRAKKRRKA